MSQSLPNSAPADAISSADLERLLVVIPTLNEAAHIDDLLQQLLADMDPELPTTIAVMDAGSTDDTVAKAQRWAARHPEVLVLRNPKRLQSAAVNLAIRCLGHGATYCVRCDAHSVYPDRYCARLIRTLRETGADGVVVPLDSLGSSRVQRAIAWVSNTPIGNGGSAHRAGRTSGFVDHGHHAAFRVSSFCKVGGYDETYSHNEDAELDCRQRALGSKIYLDATIRVGYHPRASLGALARQYFSYGKGRSRTVRRHPGSMRLRQLLVPANAVSCAAALALAPWAPGALLLPAGYAAALAAASLALAGRHRSLDALWCGPAAGIMHLSWATGFFAGLLKPEPVWEPYERLPLEPAAGSAA